MHSNAHGEPPNYLTPLALNYVYVDPNVTSTGGQTCGLCGQWYQAIHTCPSITFTPKPAPHKCPCCDGFGQRLVMQPLDNCSGTYQPCRACSGSGVIWS
jgi:hypothetical protein